MLNLAVKKRDPAITPMNLRRDGFIPAVVYGGKHESTPITVEARAFNKVLKEAGEATIVSLTGLGTAIPSLIHLVDYDPVLSTPRHIDFYAVTKGEKVEVAIPLEFIGESGAVEKGANLVKVLHEIEVSADPMNLPHNIEVDISSLVEVNDQIHAKDIKLPAGVTLITEAEEVVVLVQEVVEEKEETPVVDMGSIEVEKKGKEDSGEVAE